MKVEHLTDDGFRILSHEIPVGTVFTGAIQSTSPSMFLKAHRIIVDLRDPNRTWDDDGNSGHVVRCYRVVDAKVVVK